MNPQAVRDDRLSFEELTLQSLDRTPAGLDELMAASRACAEALAAHPGLGLQSFGQLAGQLHAFDVFYGDVMGLFGVDPAVIRDEEGTAEGCQRDFRRILDAMPVRLGQNDLAGLAALLRAELPGALARFRALVPALREYIDREYARPA
jgi:hypothetical protein